MTERRLLELLMRQLSGELTEAEIVDLNAWADASPANRQLIDHFGNEEEIKILLDKWRRMNPAAGHAKWLGTMQARRKSRVIRFASWSAAAIVLMVTVGIWLMKQVSSAPVVTPPVVAQSAAPVLPGRNTAILTLADGRKIQLDQAGRGELAVQGNVKVNKTDSVSLSYAATGMVAGRELQYNILTTPRAGQIRLLILSDGSRVWLNNATRLRYPIAFAVNERIVELTGEAYFEIARKTNSPFRVKVGDREVEVLGTSFNINAYPDEAMNKVTLLSGAVRVKNANGGPVQLRPGQQAQFGVRPLQVVSGVDVDGVLSWKNGFFYFERATLQEVLRELARWYDVKVRYEKNILGVDEFAGKIDRSLPLDEVLHSIEKSQVKTQVHFRLEGDKIVVLP